MRCTLFSIICSNINRCYNCGGPEKILNLSCVAYRQCSIVFEYSVLKYKYQNDRRKKDYSLLICILSF